MSAEQLRRLILDSGSYAPRGIWPPEFEDPNTVDDDYPYRLAIDAVQAGRLIWLGDIPAEILTPEFVEIARAWMVCRGRITGFPFTNPPCVIGFINSSSGGRVDSIMPGYTCINHTWPGNSENLIVSSFFDAANGCLARAYVLNCTKGLLYFCPKWLRDRYNNNEVLIIREITDRSIVYMAYAAILCAQPLTTVVVPHKLNAARVKKGKQPLPSHSIAPPMKFKTIIRRLKRTVFVHQGGTHASPIPHERRGHYVTRGVKTYWRRSCTVNAKVGTPGAPGLPARTHYEVSV